MSAFGRSININSGGILSPTACVRYLVPKKEMDEPGLRPGTGRYHPDLCCPSSIADR